MDTNTPREKMAYDFYCNNKFLPCVESIILYNKNHTPFSPLVIIIFYIQIKMEIVFILHILLCKKCDLKTNY